VSGHFTFLGLELHNCCSSSSFLLVASSNSFVSIASALAFASSVFLIFSHNLDAIA
jgi:hypothetical protein